MVKSCRLTGAKVLLCKGARTNTTTKNQSGIFRTLPGISYIVALDSEAIKFDGAHFIYHFGFARNGLSPLPELFYS